MMFVLDTNVLSELMHARGAMAVVEWTDAIPASDLFTTALSQAEILYVLAIMPKGRKRADRIMRADEMFADDFRGRILPFDERAAGHYADIAATRERLGRPIQPVDAQIAGIARAHGMTVVTRDVGDFAGCGIDVVNPWAS
jgi:predicted nucleic acid-binding protein